MLTEHTKLQTRLQAYYISLRFFTASLRKNSFFPSSLWRLMRFFICLVIKLLPQFTLRFDDLKLKLQHDTWPNLAVNWKPQSTLKNDLRFGIKLWIFHFIFMFFQVLFMIINKCPTVILFILWFFLDKYKKLYEDSNKNHFNIYVYSEEKNRILFVYWTFILTSFSLGDTSFDLKSILHFW